MRDGATFARTQSTTSTRGQQCHIRQRIGPAPRMSRRGDRRKAALPRRVIPGPRCAALRAVLKQRGAQFDAARADDPRGPRKRPAKPLRHAPPRRRRRERRRGLRLRRGRRVFDQAVSGRNIERAIAEHVDAAEGDRVALCPRNVTAGCCGAARCEARHRITKRRCVILPQRRAHSLDRGRRPCRDVRPATRIH